MRQREIDSRTGGCLIENSRWRRILLDCGLKWSVWFERVHLTNGKRFNTSFKNYKHWTQATVNSVHLHSWSQLDSSSQKSRPSHEVLNASHAKGKFLCCCALGKQFIEEDLHLWRRAIFLSPELITVTTTTTGPPSVKVVRGLNLARKGPGIDHRLDGGLTSVCPRGVIFRTGVTWRRKLSHSLSFSSRGDQTGGLCVQVIFLKEFFGSRFCWNFAMNAEKVLKCQLVIKMGYNKLILLTNE